MTVVLLGVWFGSLMMGCVLISRGCVSASVFYLRAISILIVMFSHVVRFILHCSVG